MKKYLWAVFTVAGLVLSSSDCGASGATRAEKKESLRALKELQKENKAELEKARKENAEAAEKVSVERRDRANEEMQKTSTELGVKSMGRAIEQVLTPADNRNSAKNTAGAINDARKSGNAKSEVTQAIMDALPGSDAQNRARETRERVATLEKEEKALEKAIKSGEKALEKTERRGGRSPNSHKDGPLEIRDRKESGKDFPDKVPDPTISERKNA